MSRLFLRSLSNGRHAGLTSSVSTLANQVALHQGEHVHAFGDAGLFVRLQSVDDDVALMQLSRRRSSSSFDLAIDAGGRSRG
ncbi:MAG: hypothetical protein U0791_04600 [Gemmataceae bacterium]